MPLEMKSQCQNCSAATPDNGVAYICSHECTFCPDEPGTTYVGKAEVLRGFQELIDYKRALAGEGPSPTAPAGQTPEGQPPEGQPPDNHSWVFRHRAFSNWSYPRVDAAGVTRWVRGFGYFEFDRRLIRRKDAFIKTGNATS